MLSTISWLPKYSNISVGFLNLLYNPMEGRDNKQ